VKYAWIADHRDSFREAAVEVVAVHLAGEAEAGRSDFRGCGVGRSALGGLGA